jgi:hypothetical protein
VVKKKETGKGRNGETVRRKSLDGGRRTVVKRNETGKDGRWQVDGGKEKTGR